jgi:hypothetical protein
MKRTSMSDCASLSLYLAIVQKKRIEETVRLTRDKRDGVFIAVEKRGGVKIFGGIKRRV